MDGGGADNDAAALFPTLRLDVIAGKIMRGGGSLISPR
jgi:hypothetical protein